MKKVFIGILAGSALLVNTAFAQTASSDNTIALVESGDDISFTSTSVSGEEPEANPFMVIVVIVAYRF